MLSQLTEITMAGERFSSEMRKAFLDTGRRPLARQELIDEVRLQEEPETNCFRLMLDIVSFDVGIHTDLDSSDMPPEYDEVSIATRRFEREDKETGETLVKAMNQQDYRRRANLVMEKTQIIKQKTAQLAIMTGAVSVSNLIFVEKVL